MRTTIAATLLAAASFLTGTAAAQVLPSQRMDIPFQFNLLGKTYPPSPYFIQYEPGTNQVEVLGVDKKLLGRMRVLTRIAQKEGAKDGKVRLVFDQVGEQRYLSEVWFPGSDGLLVRATQARHSHKSIESGQQ